jgi:hypothetical protein
VSHNKAPHFAKSVEMDIALALVRTRKHARQTAALAVVARRKLIKRRAWQKQ